MEIIQIAIAIIVIAIASLELIRITAVFCFWNCPVLIPYLAPINNFWVGIRERVGLSLEQCHGLDVRHNWLLLYGRISE
ncbi:hypothetical protein AT251_15660 [Enterovibrio nigricans]|uniref:Uncharacterized protein n=1 Tax=Enterovibrio nigricans DSM 22720 TaxID=1121868 RepID=A0A1T4V5T4_9GAMM|nr:hypothetical protein AT251_15660 [Enterovibrio nigricans]SKA60309.1 hypothetical protein SAMN02745132_03276 [Enterovibrio nigricans DSM 22720]